MDKIAELKADAKAVYGDGSLLALAKKYGVTTLRMQMIESGEISGPAFATNSDRKGMQTKLYATIKGQLRELGAE